jgi:hypothetical protein
LDRIKKFHSSQHSINRQIEREISLEAVKNVVHYPDEIKKQYSGQHGGTVYKFLKTVDSKTMIVVAEVKKTECWLMSAYRKWET